MIKEVLIIQNSIRGYAWLLEEELKKRSIPYKIINYHLGEKIPPVSNYGAIFSLGGTNSANDKFMEEELKSIQEALKENIPYLGICLGIQALVKAAGGEVIKNKIRESGFIDPEGNNFTAQLTTEGKSDPLFKNIDDILNVFHVHEETVKTTEEMTLLATGKFCKNQAIKVGKSAYGIQFHFDLTKKVFEIWLAETPSLKSLDEQAFWNSYEAIKKEYNFVGRRIFNNFLNIAGFSSS